MAETLPTEAPYTLRDILELLEYRVHFAAFEQRRQQNTKSVYTDQPANSASTQYYNAIMWSTINCPQPGRLSEQHAPTIPLYRRLLKTARLDYESDLNPAILPVILCDAIAGTSKTLAEVWNMPADEFERFWTAKENPLPKAPLPKSTKMTLGRFFDALAQIERDSHPSGPFS